MSEFDGLWYEDILRRVATLGMSKEEKMQRGDAGRGALDGYAEADFWRGFLGFPPEDDFVDRTKNIFIGLLKAINVLQLEIKELKTSIDILES